jgi:hypothetical protein
MATKKKAATKKATTKKAVKPVLEIKIQSNGNVPLTSYVDGNGKKHPPKVYWKAIDGTKSYQIVLNTPPAPFKNGNGPFPTGANGETDRLTVNKEYANGRYDYTVKVLKARGKSGDDSGGGIIVDA